MRRILGVTVALMLAAPVAAQVSLNTYTENFNGLANTPPVQPWTNNLTVAGFFAFQAGGTGPAGAVPNYLANDGTSSTAGLYSYGTGDRSERALGTIPGADPGNFAHGFVLLNNFSLPITVGVAYTGEQWRDGGTTAAQSLTFSWKASDTLPSADTDWDALNPVPAGYTAVPSLDFVSPTRSGTAMPLDGNLSQNQVVFSNTPIPVTLAPNQYLILRWFDLNDVGPNHGLAIDNARIQIIVVPEPASVLAICSVMVGLSGLAVRRFRRRTPAEVELAKSE